jgi:hypothetical protein
MSQEPWELLRDNDFTEEQWKGICDALENIHLSAEDRQELVVIKIIYMQNRFKENAAGWFGWITRPAQKAKRLQQVSTTAKKLLIAIQNAKFDKGALPPLGESAKQQAALPINRDGMTWGRFIAELIWLEKSSFDDAQRWSRIKAPPANVDLARDDAWGSLAEFYVRVTGDPPTASSRVSRKLNLGDVAGEFGALVAAFSAACAWEKSPTGDQIRGFLRSRQSGERTEKFLNARHGLPKGPRRKKPLERS